MTKKALEALERIQNLRNDSHGVAGFHRNGDIAPWDYFDFDDDLSTIRAALTPQPVDLDGLYLNEQNGGVGMALLKGVDCPKSYNKAIDHLAARGLIAAKPEPIDGQWQQIETAPKDGTEILVIDEWGIVKHVFWCHDMGGCWSIKDHEDGLLLNPMFQKKWMPLPKPPADI